MTTSTIRQVPASAPSARATLKLGRNPTKADVRREARAGADAVVKSVAQRPWHCRRLLGGLLVRREGLFLERLQHTEHVPQLLSRGRDEFAIRFVDARRLYDCDPHGITAEQAQAVRDALAAIHASGVASGDIGRHDILIPAEGPVVFLDFATAVAAGSPPVIGRLLLRVWMWRDRRRVEKLLRRYLAKRELFRRQRAARLARDARADPSAGSA